MILCPRSALVQCHRRVLIVFDRMQAFPVTQSIRGQVMMKAYQHVARTTISLFPGVLRNSSMGIPTRPRSCSYERHGVKYKIDSYIVHCIFVSSHGLTKYTASQCLPTFAPLTLPKDPFHCIAIVLMDIAQSEHFYSFLAFCSPPYISSSSSLPSHIAELSSCLLSSRPGQKAAYVPASRAFSLPRLLRRR